MTHQNIMSSYSLQVPEPVFHTPQEVLPSNWKHCLKHFCKKYTYGDSLKQYSQQDIQHAVGKCNRKVHLAQYYFNNQILKILLILKMLFKIISPFLNG